jgi:hypothetical protein
MHVPRPAAADPLYCSPRCCCASRPWLLQVLNYALSMHSVVGDATKLKAGSAGAAFRAEVAEATARATGARCGSGQHWTADGTTLQQQLQQQCQWAASCVCCFPVWCWWSTAGMNVSPQLVTCTCVHSQSGSCFLPGVVLTVKHAWYTCVQVQA